MNIRCSCDGTYSDTGVEESVWIGYRVGYGLNIAIGNDANTVIGCCAGYSLTCGDMFSWVLVQQKIAPLQIIMFLLERMYITASATGDSHQRLVVELVIGFVVVIVPLTCG